AGSATVASSRNASSAIFAFSAASIFRLVFLVIGRSVYHDKAALAPIKPLVPFLESTSIGNIPPAEAEARYYAETERLALAA
ncbi:MAG TPA: hypothetical protein VEB64_03765, partial [Azospirillaceae bacterium]|nr:hypothetical protein [Azospirillaceae bacterium]